jgi:hypothetical protein
LRSRGASPAPERRVGKRLCGASHLRRLETERAPLLGPEHRQIGEPLDPDASRPDAVAPERCPAADRVAVDWVVNGEGLWSVHRARPKGVNRRSLARVEIQAASIRAVEWFAFVIHEGRVERADIGERDVVECRRRKVRSLGKMIHGARAKDVCGPFHR